jgi:hypothetical protein
MCSAFFLLLRIRATPGLVLRILQAGLKAWMRRKNAEHKDRPKAWMRRIRRSG